MPHRRFIVIIAVVTLLSCLAAFAQGGTASDHIVTLSELETFRASVLDTARSRADALLPSLAPKLAAFDAIQLPQISTERVAAAIEYEAVMRYLDADNFFVAETPATIVLQAGERLRVTSGSTFYALSGRALLDGARDAIIADLSVGEAHYAGMSAQNGHRYVLASDALAGLRATSETTVLVLGGYQIIPQHQNRHTADALYLKEAGLMLGSNLGLELEREATRLEGLIMFLRLIGEEQAAVSYGTTHPFTDVPKWGGALADRYVAYAYDKGYTSGVSADTFGATDLISAEQYMTFVLRALGYKDNEDFVWLSSPKDAARLGIISDYDCRSLLRAGFYRDHVAYISRIALSIMK